MRKLVQVLGVGQRKTGVSKRTRQPYDFMEVSFGFPDSGFDGLRCETVTVDTALLGDRVLATGETVDAVYHQSNFKTYIDAIL